MGVIISGTLTSPTSTQLVHQSSGAIMTTQAPVDNGGDGSSFSPTDLCAASLGACVLTIIGMYAQKRGIALAGAGFQLEKIMSTEGIRKIKEIHLTVNLQTSCTEEEFELLVRAGKTCPVKKSLGAEINIHETYVRA